MHVNYRKVSRSNGYFTGDSLRYLEGRSLDGYILNKKHVSLMKSKGKDRPYSKDKFFYDLEGYQFCMSSR